MKAYSIVGMSHRNSEKLLGELPEGTPAQLVREPSNPHDSNAVAVWIAGVKVGFIPKTQNLVLAQFIDQTGAEWTGPSIPGASMALDEHETAGARVVDAKFVRSPNSRYPMVEV